MSYEYYERLAICLDNGVPEERAKQIAAEQVAEAQMTLEDPDA